MNLANDEMLREDLFPRTLYHPKYFAILKERKQTREETNFRQIMIEHRRNFEGETINIDLTKLKITEERNTFIIFDRETSILTSGLSTFIETPTHFTFFLYSSHAVSNTTIWILWIFFCINKITIYAKTFLK